MSICDVRASAPLGPIPKKRKRRKMRKKIRNEGSQTKTIYQDAKSIHQT
jgi:hypothetical protein